MLRSLFTASLGIVGILSVTSCSPIKETAFPDIDLCKITTANDSMTCYQLSQSDLDDNTVTGAVRDSFQTNFRANIYLKQADQYVAMSWYDFLNLLNYLNTFNKEQSWTD